ncbi:MAG: hypothetical protein U9P36_06810 [Thermodesulfobacteriota bacterium]|nr:hypothetical protein [Thermodesulfobacteriota bacterium]
MQQLYAKIKKSSKYFHQNEMARKNGEFPFAVEISNFDDPDLYFVQGGPGGQYRLTDVNLFVKNGSNEIRIK